MFSIFVIFVVSAQVRLTSPALGGVNTGFILLPIILFMVSTSSMMLWSLPSATLKTSQKVPGFCSRPEAAPTATFAGVVADSILASTTLSIND
ncbi:hypothetical protein ES705_16380 [subsurface metagenome]